MNATDDRGLKAAVFYDPQNDTVIGGAELTGKEMALELKLPLDPSTPYGRSLASMLSSSRKTGRKTRSAGSPAEIKLVTFVADAGGNIAAIETTVRIK